MSVEKVCEQFGKRLRKLRESRGWSQEDLAVESGISRPFISNVEAGKREPCLKTLKLLADTFGISLSMLLRGV